MLDPVNWILFSDTTLVFRRPGMKMLFGGAMKIEHGQIPGKTITHGGKEV